MELNEVIMESIKSKMHGHKKEKQKTGVEFGGDKGASIKDHNVEPKAQSDLETGLKNDISKEHENPQGEAKTGLTPEQKNTNLVKAVTAGVAHGGVGAKIKANPHIKFTPPAPATK